jgi:hypothetical protein
VEGVGRPHTSGWSVAKTRLDCDDFDFSFSDVDFSFSFEDTLNGGYFVGHVDRKI